MLLCGGQQSADRVAADPWLAMLRVVVRGSPGSVLVQTDRLGSCPPGRVLVIQPRRADDPIGPVTAAAVWLGPLASDEQLETVRTWLTGGRARARAAANLPAPSALHTCRAAGCLPELTAPPQGQRPQ